jgi:hypothetical protein
MPRRRLAFTANAGQPRATINAAWLRLLPGRDADGGDPLGSDADVGRPWTTLPPGVNWNRRKLVP